MSHYIDALQKDTNINQLFPNEECYSEDEL